MIAAIAVYGALIASGALALGVYVLRRCQAQTRQMAAMESQCADLAEQLKGLTAGGLGQCNRLTRIEDNLGRLTHRLDTVASQDSGAGPAFAQAIRLARRGAAADDIVASCGLSRMEAELVVTLHQERYSGAASD